MNSCLETATFAFYNLIFGKVCLQRCNCDLDILLSITKKMQRYTIFFIIVNAVRVSGGFSAHHQELKNCTHDIGYMSSLLKLGIYPMPCVQFLSS